MATKKKATEQPYAYLEYAYNELPEVRDYDTLYQTAVDQSLAGVKEQADEYKQQNAQRADTYNQMVDAAAREQTQVYQRNIGEVQAAERQAYDENHINELIARKNVENAMADMGLTDSGLHRSRQTQLSVMRGNADADTRGAAAKQVQALKDSIHQVWAESVQKKTAYQQGLDDELNTWQRSATATAKQNAATTAAELVKSDQEARQKVMEMNNDNYWQTINYNQQAQKNNTDYVIKQQELSLKANDRINQILDNQQKNRSQYYEQLVESGMSDDAAWATAHARYPLLEGEIGYSEEMNNYYSLYTQALKNGYGDKEAQTYIGALLNDEQVKAYYNGLSESEKKKLGNKWENARANAANKEVLNSVATRVNPLVSSVSKQLEVDGFFLNFKSGTFWRSQNEGDGNLVAEKVQSVLSASDWYQSLSAIEKSQALSASIATCILNTFPNEADTANMNRIKKACERIPDADVQLVTEIYYQKKGGKSDEKQTSSQSKQDTKQTSAPTANSTSAPNPSVFAPTANSTSAPNPYVFAPTTVPNPFEKIIK